jgi:hypothetical protein
MSTMRAPVADVRVLTCLADAEARAEARLAAARAEAATLLAAASAEAARVAAAPPAAGDPDEESLRSRTAEAVAAEAASGRRRAALWDGIAPERIAALVPVLLAALLDLAEDQRGGDIGAPPPPADPAMAALAAGEARQ